MKEVLQIAYLRHLQDFYLFESVKDGIILFSVIENNLQHGIYKSFCENMSGFEQKREHISASFEKIQLLFRLHHPHRLHRMCIQSVHDLYMSFRK